MGFSPTGYEEVFVASPGQDTTDINMICRYPEDRTEEHAIRDDVVGKSEMVVTHRNNNFWDGERS
jgi:hypothetical protein